MKKSIIFAIAALVTYLLFAGAVVISGGISKNNKWTENTNHISLNEQVNILELSVNSAVGNNRINIVENPAFTETKIDGVKNSGIIKGNKHDLRVIIDSSTLVNKVITITTPKLSTIYVQANHYTNISFSMKNSDRALFLDGNIYASIDNCNLTGLYVHLKNDAHIQFENSTIHQLQIYSSNAQYNLNIYNSSIFHLDKISE
jgi:hypothetical protein